MAEAGVPVPFNASTLNIASTPGPSEPKKLQFIDGFYKFSAMDEMNSKTKELANFWIQCYNRWEQLEGLFCWIFV